jgi:hypothetical protein
MPHLRQMDFTERPLPGYVFVDEPGWVADADLVAWVRLAFVQTLLAKALK